MFLTIFVTGTSVFPDHGVFQADQSFNQKKGFYGLLAGHYLPIQLVGTRFCARLPCGGFIAFVDPKSEVKPNTTKISGMSNLIGHRVSHLHLWRQMIRSLRGFS